MKLIENIFAHIYIWNCVIHLCVIEKWSKWSHKQLWVSVSHWHTLISECRDEWLKKRNACYFFILCISNRFVQQFQWFEHIDILVERSSKQLNVLRKLKIQTENFFGILISTRIIQELAKNNNKNIQTDIIVMDFAKTFDKVPHKRLLYKLNHLLRHWIQHLEKDRRFFSHPTY